MAPAEKAAPPAGSTALAICLLAIAALSWAGNYVVGRAVAGEVPPVGLAVGRWLLSVLLMLPIAWPHLRRDGPVLAARWRFMAVAGITGSALFGTLQYAGLQLTTATNGGLLSATSAVWIALAGAVLFADRLSARQCTGLAVSLAGALVIAAKGDPANLAGLRFDVGDLMILTTLIAWGIYSAMLRLRPPVHWSSFTLTVFAIGLVANLPFAVAEHAMGHPLRPTLATAGAILYAGVISSVVGFAVWSRGVEILGAPRAGVYLNLIPIFSVALAVLLLGERPRGYHLAACVLVFSGLYLATTRARR